MKGLLLKDFYIAKLQKTFGILILVMGIAFSFLWESPYYMVGFLTFIATIFVLTTISYDEFDNGYAFLFTLPISRKLYVSEKYVFALLYGGGTWCVTTALAAAYAAVSGRLALDAEWLMSYMVYLGFVLLIISVTVPVQLKFGGNKGRTAMIITLGGLFLVCYGSIYILKKAGINIEEIFSRLSTMGTAALWITGFVILILILFFSFGLSVQIMKKKEF